MDVEVHALLMNTLMLLKFVEDMNPADEKQVRALKKKAGQRYGQIVAWMKAQEEKARGLDDNSATPRID